jgi:hypothetical protein
MVGLLVAVSGPGGVAHSAQVVFPVGMRQVEFVDRTSDAGDRTLAMRVFYPAEAPPLGAQPMRTPFCTGLTVYPDLPPATGGARHPLILSSHGRGSNGLPYACLTT